MNIFLLNCYTKCDKFPLSSFIECMNGKYLFIKRTSLPVPKKVILKAWSSIFEEYCRISKNSGYDSFYEGMKSVYCIDSKLTAVSSALEALKEGYKEESIMIIRSYGYNYKFSKDNKDEFFMDLCRVVDKCKMLLIEEERAQKRFADLCAQEKQKGMSDHFQTALVRLSKFMGYRIDPKKITVSEFCNISQEYKKELERIYGKQVN